MVGRRCMMVGRRCMMVCCVCACVCGVAAGGRRGSYLASCKLQTANCKLQTAIPASVSLIYALAVSSVLCEAARAFFSVRLNAVTAAVTAAGRGCGHVQLCCCT